MNKIKIIGPDFREYKGYVLHQIKILDFKFWVIYSDYQKSIKDTKKYIKLKELIKDLDYKILKLKVKNILLEDYDYQRKYRN